MTDIEQEENGYQRERILKRIHIGIGELYASREHALISTVLGSCVSVCLYDPANKVGGMNHIFLPGTADLREFNDSARYGINAMELLINRMLSLKAARRTLRAKVFGGGQLLNGSSEPGVFSTGEANIGFAFNFLCTEKIPVDSYNVGGTFARKIELDSLTGEVLLMKIMSGPLSDIKRIEQKYQKNIRDKVRKSGGVALF